MYSPILRNRQSEMLALRTLPGGVRQLVTPVLDVASPTKSADQAAGQKYVRNNITRMSKAVAGFSSAFIDSSELDPAFRLLNGVHPLAAAASALSDAGVRVIPVTGLHRDDAHHAAAADVRKLHPDQLLGIRLDATDVSTATLTHRAIGSYLNARAVDTGQAYLLVDLQCLHDQDAKSQAALVTRLFNLLDDEMWAGAVIGGYGFPDQLSTALSTSEQTYLPRVEQNVFAELAGGQWHSPLWFADYTVVSPAVVELDWKLIRKVMTPKALYTLTDSWFVVRGGAFSSHADGYAQYYAMAEEIVSLEEFCGEDYSAGDRYISERAQREGTPGSPASWISACVNHHVTFTANAYARSPS